uniref:Saposin B-type domain-containing protein n=1 Tax=Denticeps clupeoides TaxID=299321 RepID=A0AAY4ACS4_9TELE
MLLTRFALEVLSCHFHSLRTFFLLVLFVRCCDNVNFPLPRGQHTEDIGSNPNYYHCLGSGVEKKNPGLCWVCKWAIKKAKNSINTTNETMIRYKLHHVCDRILYYIKSICKNFVNKYMDILVRELSTTDDVKTICQHLKVCK